MSDTTKKDAQIVPAKQDELAQKPANEASIEVLETTELDEVAGGMMGNTGCVNALARCG